jgi:hypothetical protein
VRADAERPVEDDLVGSASEDGAQALRVRIAADCDPRRGKKEK